MEKQYSEYKIYKMKGDWCYYYVYRTRLDAPYPWYNEGYIIGHHGYTAYALFFQPEPSPEYESRIWGAAATHQIKNKGSIVADTDDARAAREALRLDGLDNKHGIQMYSHTFPEQVYVDWPFDE